MRRKVRSLALGHITINPSQILNPKSNIIFSGKVIAFACANSVEFLDYQIDRTIPGKKRPSGSRQIIHQNTRPTLSQLWSFNIRLRTTT